MPIETRKTGTNCDTLGAERNRALDLLRILAMWFILTAHFMGWGGAVNSLTPHDLNYYWVMPIYFASQIGNTLFFMLSGYFAKRPQLKKGLLLERKAAFYSTVITWVVFALGGGTLSYAIRAMFPILFKKYWFISVYLVLYCLELFLIPGMERLNRKEFLMIMAAMFLNNTLNDNPDYTLMQGLLAFMIGFYQRSFPRKSRKKRELLIAYILFMSMYAIERIVMLKLGIEHSRWDQISRYTLLTAAASSLFALFTRFNVSWVWPGKLAPHILSVYLISANPAITDFLYNRVLKVSELSEKVFFLPYYIAVNFLLILLCAQFDKLVSKWNTLEVGLLLKGWQKNEIIY